MDRQQKLGHRINWTDTEGSNGLDKGPRHNRCHLFVPIAVIGIMNHHHHRRRHRHHHHHHHHHQFMMPVPVCLCIYFLRILHVVCIVWNSVNGHSFFMSKPSKSSLDDFV